MDQRNPFRCFDRKFMAVTMGIALAMLAVAFVSSTLPRGGGGRIALAVVQGALVAVLVVQMARAVLRLDEMHRRLHVEAAAVAFVASAALFTFVGFLEKPTGWHVPWGVAAWPAMSVLWVVSVQVLRRRYGA